MGWRTLCEISYIYLSTELWFVESANGTGDGTCPIGSLSMTVPFIDIKAIEATFHLIQALLQ